MFKKFLKTASWTINTFAKYMDYASKVRHEKLKQPRGGRQCDRSLNKDFYFKPY